MRNFQLGNFLIGFNTCLQVYLLKRVEGVYRLIKDKALKEHVYVHNH